MTTEYKKQRVVVVCPGRGTYNKEELGYFHRYHHDKQEILTTIDSHRALKGQPTVASLDLMDSYTMRTHTAGENASSLIYTCAMADFMAIDRHKYDIVAVTGNSMGWYIAMATSGALKPKPAIELINTMGSMMAAGIIGGQLIYPVMDENWHISPDKITHINQLMTEVNQIEQAEIYLSISLGGYVVLGGNTIGLKGMELCLPMIDDRYPMRLFNHAAFHTPLLNDIANKAQLLLPQRLFNAPTIPLVDGKGNIWQPYNTDVNALYQYTLGTQITQPYHYTKAITVSVKEFAPDKIIILGPGSTLGGATAQSLIAEKWQGITNKQSFIERQKSDPFILSMGIEAQRQCVV